MAPDPKNILITGAGGLVGPLLARRLLDDPSYRVVLTDLVDPVVPAGVAHPEHATCIRGDITDPAFVQSLLEAAKPLHAVFIFHGIMSAGSEADYDLSLRVNVDSVRGLLLALRRAQPGNVRVVYTSSQAVYGGPGLPAVITDDVAPEPESTYGAHKLAVEVLLNDMHRRGFVDAFVLRLPTVVVRPGRPTQAASSWVSGMIREPMNGQECQLPLCDRSFRSFVCSPSSLQENLMRVLSMPSGALPRHRRHINVPGVAASTQELMDALARHGGPGGAQRLALLREPASEEDEDPATRAILRSWPQDFDPATPLRLGLVRDESPDDLVREYVESLRGEKQQQ
ncbi:hypothetical protein GGR56DRAFT_662923 [Xylariaceae sp. FL0804]|nr:hypothetical protein GGR56DRAFT_662923 [Xylariaceae sp. FL0804]